MHAVCGGRWVGIGGGAPFIVSGLSGSQRTGRKDCRAHPPLVLAQIWCVTHLIGGGLCRVVPTVHPAGNVEEGALAGGHPEVAAARIEDDLEGLGRGAQGDLAIVLQEGTAGWGDSETRGGMGKKERHSPRTWRTRRCNR